MKVIVNDDITIVHIDDNEIPGFIESGWQDELPAGHTAEDDSGLSPQGTQRRNTCTGDDEQTSKTAAAEYADDEDDLSLGIMWNLGEAMRYGGFSALMEAKKRKRTGGKTAGEETNGGEETCGSF